MEPIKWLFPGRFFCLGVIVKPCSFVCLVSILSLYHVHQLNRLIATIVSKTASFFRALRHLQMLTKCAEMPGRDILQEIPGISVINFIYILTCLGG